MIREAARVSLLLIIWTALASAGIYPPTPGDSVVSVPFEFKVGTQTLLAGEYIIHSDRETGETQICEDGVYCVALQTIPRPVAEKAADQPEMVFRGEGSQHVLTQVRSPRFGTLALSAAEPDASGRRRKAAETRIQGHELRIHSFEGITLSWD